MEGRERYVSTDVTGAVSNRGKISLSVVAQMLFLFKKKRRERLTTDVRRRTKKEVYWVAARGGAGEVIFLSMWGSLVRRRERMVVLCVMVLSFLSSVLEEGVDFFYFVGRL